MVHTLEKRLDGLTETIMKHKARGNALRSNKRSWELVGRYEDLMAEAKQAGVWHEYCEARGLAFEHYGSDLFA